jgi:tripartite-type tricarboxylate transporter receptor subunit TctC
MKTCPAARIFPLALFVCCPGLVCAQEYPTKPIRLLSGETGGQGDSVSRLIAQGLVSGGLGQQVIVDNRPSMGMGDLLARAPNPPLTRFDQFARPE